MSHLAAMGAALVIVTLAAFWGVRSSGFVHLDDDRYVTENPRVQGGLTWENVKWSFTTLHLGFYYPATWLSHMADVQLFGPDAGKHHLTSLFLHALSALILFLSLARMTGAFWRSSLVAALFAIHPLHVESVAWISERKDVLCTLFGFMCLFAYAMYAERPSVKRYLPVFALLLLGLMAKSMVVTLPAVLLLMDYWPLGRWPSGEPVPGSRAPEVGAGKPATMGRLLLEKVPLLALVSLFAVLTWVSQTQMQAVRTLQEIPWGQRLANAALSCTSYILKTLVPGNLAVSYPHPRGGVSYGLALLCGLALVAATGAAVRFGRRRRYAAVGWLWYLVTLVPVIGLVQVGNQGRADRYTYIPLVGLFVAIAWGIAEVAGRRPLVRTWISAAAVGWLVVLFAMTRVQVGYWSDSVALFEHSLAVTPEDFIIQTNLGAVLAERGRPVEAIPHLQRALRINPNDAETRNDLGNALSAAGRTTEAIEHYREALRIRPGAPQPLANLGLALQKAGRVPEAVECLEGAVRAHPGALELQTALATVLLRDGQGEKAIGRFEQILAAKPDSPEALNGLGTALMKAGRFPEAVDPLRRAVQASPGSAEFHENLAVALDYSGRIPEAIEQFHQALRIRPDSPEIWNNLGKTFGDAGRFPEAIGCFQRAIDARPDYAEASNNLGIALTQVGRVPEAIRCFQRALQIDPGLTSARENLRALSGSAGAPAR